MNFAQISFLIVLGSITLPALAQTDIDPESAYAFKLEKEADVVIDYDNLVRIKTESLAPQTFADDQAGFDYLASLKKRNNVVVILGKSLRARNNLEPVVDGLETQLKKLGFNSIVFELASAEARPIYRIYKKS